MGDFTLKKFCYKKKQYKFNHKNLNFNHKGNKMQVEIKY